MGGVGPSGRTQYSAQLTEPKRSSEPRYWHSPQSTPPLAETWEPPSLSRLACTPYYRRPRCKIVQCPRTPLCWTYGPTAGTRINPCVTVLPLASTSGTRNTQHHHWLGPDCRVRTPTESKQNGHPRIKCSKMVIQRSKCRTNKNRMNRLFFFIGTRFLHGRGVQHYHEEKSKFPMPPQIKVFRKQGAWAQGRSRTS